MTMLHSIRLVMLAGVPLPTPVSRGATTDSALPTGSVLIALVASPVGIYVAGTAIAYLEHSCRFKAPVRAGDTIATRWTVTAKSDKPKHKGGIIEMAGQATNQRNQLAVECEGKILVASKAR
jgi:3-hydroxybutyryl-CoA dehydratase